MAQLPATICDALAADRKTVTWVGNQPITLCGWGPSDAGCRMMSAGSDPSRNQTFALVGTLPGNSKDITFGVQSCTLLATGETDGTDDVQFGLPKQTQANTNIAKSGGMSFCNGVYIATMMSYEILDFYQLSSATTKYINQFLSTDAHYRSVIAVMAMTGASASLQIQDTGCTQKFGALSAWIGATGLNGGGLTTLGYANLPVTATTFMSAMLFYNGDNTSCQSTLTINFDTPTVIANAPAGPFTTVLQSDQQTELFDADVRVAVKVYLWGYMAIVPAQLMCGIQGFGTVGLTA